jgi:hypothetical protein
MLHDFSRLLPAAAGNSSESTAIFRAHFTMSIGGGGGGGAGRFKKKAGTVVAATAAVLWVLHSLYYIHTAASFT